MLSTSPSCSPYKTWYFPVHVRTWRIISSSLKAVNDLGIHGDTTLLGSCTTRLRKSLLFTTSLWPSLCWCVSWAQSMHLMPPLRRVCSCHYHDLRPGVVRISIWSTFVSEITGAPVSRKHPSRGRFFFGSVRTPCRSPNLSPCKEHQSKENLFAAE